ncbi:hypothetical protein N7478_002805 [Penicillium angulare]|uniref:uncharacterized protein n=1 Tax=Penicillium angulare TaxID=116970 RepID=UPI00253F7221|nr:uncharacterized protein N7478_002805 [Penicillium angulare]KAJ5287119.1 hypothetical protein N7478_002805 [Penicillium angulare]
MSTLETNPDYSEENENKPLPFNLYEEDDEEQDLWIKSRLESLVNGALQPSQLAAEIDNKTTEDTNRQYEALVSQLKEGDDDDLVVPPPRIHLSPLFSAIVRLLFAFPAKHPGQNAIVELLLALKALPRHPIYAGLPSDDLSKPHPTVTLWPFGEPEGDWQMFWLYFHDEIFEWLPPYRLRNLNSAMARLTALEICNCAEQSALQYILPSSRDYPDLEKRPIDGPNILGNNLIAAAQWILTSDEGRFVYRECQSSESQSESEDSWSIANWQEWKRQFAFVAGDERFAVNYRTVAGDAHRRMLEYEGK